MTVAFDDPGWVDEMLEVARKAPKKPPEGPTIHPGSLWVSRLTHRRCSVSWATRTQVKACYTDHAFKVHSADAFLRLYEPVL